MRRLPRIGSLKTVKSPVKCMKLLSLHRYACVRPLFCRNSRISRGSHCSSKFSYLHICSPSFSRISVQVQPHFIAFVAFLAITHKCISRYTRRHDTNGVKYIPMRSMHALKSHTQLTKSRFVQNLSTQKCPSRRKI